MWAGTFAYVLDTLDGSATFEIAKQIFQPYPPARKPPPAPVFPWLAKDSAFFLIFVVNDENTSILTDVPFSRGH